MRGRHRRSRQPRPEPAGRQDIMQDQDQQDGTPGEEGAAQNGRGSPLPPDAARREDVLSEEPDEPTAGG